MFITERQKNILDGLIKEYIDTAKPISSDLLEQSFGFDCSPATIRNEMKKLTEMGFLEQPHTSAGRIPTNKAYRFFVDEIEEEGIGQKTSLAKKMVAESRSNEQMKILENLAKGIASASLGLAFAYLKDADLVWKEGWKEVFKNPEFNEKGIIGEFMQAVEEIENNMGKFEDVESPRVYIGKENPASDSAEFSLIISKSMLPENKETILAIFGPTRMPYQKNINLINSLIEELKEI